MENAELNTLENIIKYADQSQRQLELEDKMASLGADKFFKNEDRLMKFGGMGETVTSKVAARDMFGDFRTVFYTYISEELEKASGGGPKTTLVKHGLYDLISPEQIARVLVATILSAVNRPSSRQIQSVTLNILIGRRIEDAIKMNLIEQHFSKEKDDLMDMLKRTGIIEDQEEVAKRILGLSEKHDIGFEGFKVPEGKDDDIERLKVGGALRELFNMSLVS